jgi:HD-like signal output (HDOD) protein/prolyl-tRNA editing enzyme YbaK/EbsC (Cys-tRNA(Pro) deacylase)
VEKIGEGKKIKKRKKLMAIPAAVDTLLRTHNIDYSVMEVVPEGATLPTVQTVVLGDDTSRVQVLFPADCLLDLNALIRATGRQLRALPSVELFRLCQKQSLQQVPALPSALGLPTIVDRRLLDRGEEALASGMHGQLLCLSGEQFRRSLVSADVHDFAVELSRLQHGRLDHIDDISEITKAIADFTQLRMKQRLEETLELPPLPETAQKIIKLRVDPHADIRHLTAIVELDPALAAQVVSWASSPYYAAPGKIRSVHDAIVRVLGFDLVLNLALGLALGKSLSLPKDQPRGFTPYWEQSVYVAAAVEALVGCISPDKRPTIGLAYLTGLLHNFGQLLLAEIFPPHFSSYCRYQEANPHAHYTYIERHLLGISRDQLAGWLMKLWSMPDEVCTGLRHQSNPDYDGPNSAYANLVYVALHLLRLHDIGNAPLEPVPAAIYERLHLDPGKAMQAIQHVVEASDEVKAIAAGLASA